MNYVPCRFCGDTNRAACCTGPDGERQMRDSAIDAMVLEGYELGACRDAFYGGIASAAEGSPSLQFPAVPTRDPRFTYGLLDSVDVAKWHIEQTHTNGAELDFDSIY